MSFVEGSTKAGWLLLKALRKQGGFCSKFYESRMAILKALRKQGGFRPMLYSKQDGFH